MLTPGRPPPAFPPNYGTPANLDSLDRILNLTPSRPPAFDSGFSNHQLPIHGVVRSDQVDFYHLQVPEDRQFAESILNTLWALEPHNSLVVCKFDMGQTTFYIFAEGLKNPIGSKTLNLFYNLPYPVQGVSGVTVAESCPPQEGRPHRFVVGFIPRHLQQQIPPQLPSHPMLSQPSPMLLESPVGMNAQMRPLSHHRRVSRSSSESPERDRSSSPQRGFLGTVGNMGKAVLGFQSDTGKSKRGRKTRGRR